VCPASFGVPVYLFSSPSLATRHRKGDVLLSFLTFLFAFPTVPELSGGDGKDESRPSSFFPSPERSPLFLPSSPLLERRGAKKRRSVRFPPIQAMKNLPLPPFPLQPGVKHLPVEMKFPTKKRKETAGILPFLVSSSSLPGLPMPALFGRGYNPY